METILGWALVVLMLGCVVVYRARAEPAIIDPPSRVGGDR
jgi:hypothetical protein